jgi:PhzF family phenazine biosynthesis protein
VTAGPLTPRVFTQLDVFASGPLTGNPLAVVHDADDLTDEQMAAVARWTNLSETTFLVRPADPGADYGVRIFTPGGELPFAGHPTLGSAQAWLLAGGVPRDDKEIVQECGVGLVRVRPDGDRLAFAAPPLIRSGPVERDLVERLAAALGLASGAVRDAQWVDNGPGWVALLLGSREQVLAVQPDAAVLGDLKVGLIGPWTGPDRDADFEVRAFVPSTGILEDPVTGSLNAGLGQWLIGAGLAPASYVASQGTALQRRGRVFVDQSGDDVWLGGLATAVVSGTIALPG